MQRFINAAGRYSQFLEDLGVDFDEEEMDLGQLHSSLQNGLIKLKGLYTAL